MVATGWMAVGLLLYSCTHNVNVAPVEFKPIHMTLDINLKVDRALDDFFDFEDEYEVPEDVDANGGAE